MRREKKLPSTKFTEKRGRMHDAIRPPVSYWLHTRGVVDSSDFSSAPTSQTSPSSFFSSQNSCLIISNIDSILYIYVFICLLIE